MQELPDLFSVEELFDKVILPERIERGMQQSRAGQVKDTAQAKEQLRNWLRTQAFHAAYTPQKMQRPFPPCLHTIISRLPPNIAAYSSNK